MAIRLIVCILLLPPALSIGSYLNPDVSTLMNVKLQLLDPMCALVTWDASRPICSWQGVQWIVSNSVLLDCSDPISFENISMNADSNIAVYSLHLEEAGLVGPVPRSLASLASLYELNMTGNNLSGSIPCELVNIPELNLLDLSRNSLTGELCLDTDLVIRSFSYAANYGNADCAAPLRVLNIQHNRLSGSIPSSLGTFTCLRELDLSYNQLSGSIPSTLTRLTNLRRLSLAYNHLSGPIPAFEETFDASCFAGNDASLCGVPLQDCSRTVVPWGRRMNRGILVGIISGTVAVAFVIGSIIFLAVNFCYVRRKVRSQQEEANEEINPADGREQSVATLQYFEGGERLATDNVWSAVDRDLLGENSYSTTQRAKLRDGSSVALRRLNDTAIAANQDVFLRTVREMGRVRHPNLVPLRGFYSGAAGERILVFDYMSRGNLKDLLHRRSSSTPAPGWARRHKIILGAAKGLAHLHTGGGGLLRLRRRIVHGNVKAQNILLDDNYEAHLCGYSVHGLLNAEAAEEARRRMAREGYLAPELVAKSGGGAEIRATKGGSRRSDVYSLGVVMLEILTGREASEGGGGGDAEEEAERLPKVVRRAAGQNKVAELLDIELLTTLHPSRLHDLLSCLRLAMACCSPLPHARPSIRHVVRRLNTLHPLLGSSLALPSQAPSSSPLEPNYQSVSPITLGAHIGQLHVPISPR